MPSIVRRDIPPISERCQLGDLEDFLDAPILRSEDVRRPQLQPWSHVATDREDSRLPLLSQTTMLLSRMACSSPRMAMHGYPSMETCRSRIRRHRAARVRPCPSSTTRRLGALRISIHVYAQAERADHQAHEPRLTRSTVPAALPFRSAHAAAALEFDRRAAATAVARCDDSGGVSAPSRATPSCEMTASRMMAAPYRYGGGGQPDQRDRQARGDRRKG